MSRARILADYVSSGDELALKAPITNAALVTPNLGTPSAGVLTNATGLVATTGLTASGTKSSGTFLRGDNTWDAAGGANTPNFMVTKNNNQSVNNNEWTKIQIDDEDFDVGGCYNNTGSTVTLNGISVPAYAFAPNVAGKYYLVGGVGFSDSGAAHNYFVRFYKDGSADTLRGQARVHTSITTHSIVSFSTIVEANGSSNYFEIFALQQRASGSLDTHTEGVVFGGFKIIE